MPWLTGTLWPSLPQVQPPVSSRASFAAIVMLRRDSGPLPMMLTSLIGAVILPSFDEPAVLDVERVVAGADLHLTVREGLGDDAVIDGRDDLVLRVCGPSSMNVQRMRGIGAKRYDSRRPEPVGVSP